MKFFLELIRPFKKRGEKKKEIDKKEKDDEMMKNCLPGGDQREMITEVIERRTTKERPKSQ